MTASSFPKSIKKLQPILPPKLPWHHIGIDLVTDLPANSHGYKHIIVAVCYLTKFVTARPLSTKTTQSVLDALTRFDNMRTTLYTTKTRLVEIKMWPSWINL